MIHIMHACMLHDLNFPGLVMTYTEHIKDTKPYYIYFKLAA